MQLARYRDCLSLGRHEQADVWVRVVQPDDSAYELCRVCGLLRWPQGEPDLAAMQRAFADEWAKHEPWRFLDAAGNLLVSELPDAPFLAALHAAWFGEGPTGDVP
mgnify:CR=1 FL=1